MPFKKKRDFGEGEGKTAFGPQDGERRGGKSGGKKEVEIFKQKAAVDSH